MTFFSRYTAFILCLIITIIAGFFAMWRLVAIAGLLSLIGVCDLVQRRHSIQRNYPIIGHIRWLVEMIRPSNTKLIMKKYRINSAFRKGFDFLGGVAPSSLSTSYEVMISNPF